MSITESMYGERFFELEQDMIRQMDMENGQRQYKLLVEEGEIDPNELTFEQWYEAGNYDPNDWD